MHYTEEAIMYTRYQIYICVIPTPKTRVVNNRRQTEISRLENMNYLSAPSRVNTITKFRVGGDRLIIVMVLTN